MPFDIEKLRKGLQAEMHRRGLDKPPARSLGLCGVCFSKPATVTSNTKPVCAGCRKLPSTHPNRNRGYPKAGAA